MASDRKSTRLNSSHVAISYAVFCLKKKIDALYGLGNFASVSLDHDRAETLSQEAFAFAQETCEPFAMTQAFFFFNDPATTEIYTLSLHDALPISRAARRTSAIASTALTPRSGRDERSEEHTSELQSRGHLVCRLLLEKKKS